LNIFDSKAIEEHLHVQANGSFAGCPFCKTVGGGTSIGDISKVVFIGSRVMLDLKHYLRFIGQSKNCCPKKFYTERIPKNYTTNNNSYRPQDFNVELYDETMADNNCRSGWNDTDELRTFYNIAWSDSTKWIWHHDKYPGVNFKDDLYYFHCDLRPMDKQKRKTSAEYRADAEIATLTKQPFNGVKGEWNEAKLPYLKFEENINYDPFHTITLLSTYTLKHWKGQRINSDKIKNFCEKNSFHPSVVADNPKWVIKNVNKSEVRFILFNICILYIIVLYNCIFLVFIYI
jgi:hypothetical protein